MKAFLIAATAICAIPALSAAQEPLISADEVAKARCFQFEVESVARHLELEPNMLIGCYIPVSEREQLAFIKDSEGANKFSTALTETNDEGKISLKHFSLSAGEESRVKQKVLTLNPLPIPPTLEQTLELEDVPTEVNELAIFSDTLRAQLNEIMASYYKESLQDVVVDEDFAHLNDNKINSEAFHLPVSKQPADGYWWPHTGVPLANGPSSPLGKYDAYVAAVTGKNPNSVQWEIANHHTDTFWAGHCNGWVASSILYGFDGKDLYDHHNGVTISASDIQGLRTATSYCVSNTVIGSRYNSARNDVSDVHPDVFHRTLQYYIRMLQKPIAMDYLSMMPVDNHIISGYEFFYEPAGGTRYLVTAKLKVHGYNYGRVSVKQVAKSYELVYRYYLWKDSRGRVVGGRWVNNKDHPDFMWVPLNQSKCRGENPRMDHAYVDHMLRNLKPLRRY